MRGTIRKLQHSQFFRSEGRSALVRKTPSERRDFGPAVSVDTHHKRLKVCHPSQAQISSHRTRPSDATTRTGRLPSTSPVAAVSWRHKYSVRSQQRVPGQKILCVCFLWVLFTKQEHFSVQTHGWSKCVGRFPYRNSGQHCDCNTRENSVTVGAHVTLTSELHFEYCVRLFVALVSRAGLLLYQQYERTRCSCVRDALTVLSVLLAFIKLCLCAGQLCTKTQCTHNTENGKMHSIT